MTRFALVAVVAFWLGVLVGRHFDESDPFLPLVLLATAAVVVSLVLGIHILIWGTVDLWNKY